MSFSVLARKRRRPLSPLSPPVVPYKPLTAMEPSLPMTPPDPDIDPIPSIDPIVLLSLDTVVHVISTEREALVNLEQIYKTDQLSRASMERAVDQVTSTINGGGKLVICGVGKSGKIGEKLVATMNSLGIQSCSLHPTEALHGDLGMIRQNDTLLFITFSGKTPELLMLLPHLPPTLAVIAITAHMHSTSCALFGDSDVRNTILLPAPVHEREEVSFGLPAPTTSTTVALAVGDALALATARRLHVMPGRGPAEVFKSFHPGGAIGAAFASSSNSLVTPSSSSASSATASPSSAPLNGIPGQLDCIAPPLQLTHQKLISSIAIPFASIPVLSKIEPISSNVRVSDVLAAAVRHPDAKFWVLINPDLIVTPTRLRLLADIRDCGKRLYDLDEESYSIARMGWVRVPDFSSIASVRQILNGLDSALKSQRDATSIKTFTKGRVIAIVSKKIEDRILGFVEEKEIWRDDV